MINKLSTIVNIDRDEPYCKRAKLDTGTQCNYNCSFCYYGTRLNETTSFQIIKQRVDYLVECGIKDVDLSGGESSIHGDWFNILDYCKSKGLKISTVSNGSMFSSFAFTKRSQEHGLEEILFSLHGYNRESHNAVVGNRSAFTSIINAIKNANDLGIRVRINCVVTEHNYKHLKEEYLDLVRNFDCLEINFLTLNFWGDARNTEPVDYNKVSREIKRTIDLMDVKYINVRYIPYCYMVGYEKHVCNTYQHIYDVYDWNMAVYNGDIKPEDYKSNELKHLFNAADKDRVGNYYKKRECMNCAYFYLCDGLENGVDQEVFPVVGERIRDINYYRKGFYEN